MCAPKRENRPGRWWRSILLLRRPGASEQYTVIPKRIIQTGPENLPLFLKACTLNARLLHPGFEYVFFDDSEVELFIQTEFPQYQSTFHSYQSRIQRYDFFRYLAVYRYGGFYLDLDVLLAEPLTSLLECDCVFSFEEMTYSRYFWDQFRMDWQVGNYAFGASPGHPFLAGIIENCVRAQEDPTWVAPMMAGIPKIFRRDYYILNSTGPGLVSRMLGENPSRADVTILIPKDIGDVRNWYRFGDLGVHNMMGSWRTGENHFLRKLTRLWREWNGRRAIALSGSRVNTRRIPVRNSHPVSDV
jgi:inositol phosphorylceramide mannosyltransferase catalytic subunit